MHPAIPQLVELQRLDQLMAGLRADLETLPKKMREIDAKLTAIRAALASAKEANTQGLTKRKKLELDVEQWKERAKKYRAQSSSVKTNEAYKALQQEIGNAEAEAAKAEDLVLEQMMALEQTERQVKHAEADLKEAEQQVATDKKRIESEHGEKKKKLEAAVAERELIAKGVPEDLLDLYNRIARKHPGSVMAEVREGMCRACGLRVLPHTAQVLPTETNEEVFRCESCGRILYTLEPIPHAAPRESANGAANS